MNSLNYKFVFCLTMGLLFSSCASYKLKYDKGEENWSQRQPDLALELDHTMYLIGDAGNSTIAPPALALLGRKLDEAPINSSVIFLGDNIYPGGLPAADSSSARLTAEKKLMTQLDILDDFKGRPIFLPGNHDNWYDGVMGVRRQEEFVEAYLNRGIENEKKWTNYYLPDGGCSGPEIVELSDQVVVIVVNSVWWLTDWNKDPFINYNCDIKTRYAFTFWFEEATRKYRTKNVVIAQHHPIYSYGPHGGASTPKEHLFPLTELDDNLWIPLPGIGSLGALFRATVGLRQDLANPVYKDLISSQLAGTQKNGRYIFASGHEHNLQYIEQDDQFFIVSGAGSKDSPAKLGKGSLFKYGRNGFAKIDFYKDGSSWVEYWISDPLSEDGKLVYRRKMQDKIQFVEEPEQEEEIEPYEIEPDSVTAPISTKNIGNKGPFHNVVLGKHFRKLYTYDYEFPTLNVSTFKGGLEPVKVGGGGQTNSLRMEDEDGKQYAFRSTTKDASRFIPYPFNELTPTQDLVEDNFLSAHPFAAIAVPPMAEAINVYHTDPKLYYVPKQAALREYNASFGDEVFLVEKRPNDDNAKDYRSQHGKGDEVMSTLDLLDKMHKDFKHQPDQSWVARSRLFDLVIGDWDRHDDQWRWVGFKTDDDKKAYMPIPRDRDQPFCKYDGLVTGFARLTMPFLKQLRSYKKNIGNIKWSTFNGRQFDRAFLNELPWEDWQEQVRFIQKNLTDEIIDEAFSVWPEPALSKSAGSIKEILRYRRNNLMSIARKHYENLAKEVEIVGTKRDRFEVERINDKETVVRVYELSKKGKKKDKAYERTFYKSETREIRIFGLGGDDQFDVSGSVNNGIRVRLIGGLGADAFVDSSKVKGSSHRTKVYDTWQEKNTLTSTGEVTDKRSDNSYFNQYHRRDYYYEYDFVMPLPLIGFNPDDGLFLGAAAQYTHYSFKKEPYSQTHLFSGQYAFETNAFDLNYSGSFLHVFNEWDFQTNIKFQGQKFVVNYFGYGNETKNEAEDDDFNRVRQAMFRINPGVRKRLAGDAGSFTLGPIFERVLLDSTAERFVVGDDAGFDGPLDPDVFEPFHYVGAVMNFNFRNLDNASHPKRGLKFDFGMGWRSNLDNGGKSFADLNSSLTIYQSFFPDEWIVFATKLGVGHTFGTFGESFEFFQAPTLGGMDNIRGYRRDRFHGKTVFFHNNDLRLQILNSENTFIPFSVGITGGFDYGRVWIEEEDSNKWHYGYGGGLWIAPIDFFVIHGEYFLSDDDEIMTIKLGFSF